MEAILEQREWAAQLDRGRGWLEDQWRRWQALAEEQERVVEQQRVWIGELETGKAWLEGQWESWQAQAEHWQAQAEYWQAQTEHWQESFWGRLGRFLKIVNPAQPFPASETEPND